MVKQELVAEGGLPEQIEVNEGLDALLESGAEEAGIRGARLMIMGCAALLGGLVLVILLVARFEPAVVPFGVHLSVTVSLFFVSAYLFLIGEEWRRLRSRLRAQHYRGMSVLNEARRIIRYRELASSDE